MVQIENRASVVLYNFLKSNRIEGAFLLPANVCPIVPLTFLKAGIAFEFVDIDSSHAMDKQHCLSKLADSKYTGVLFVHSYGKVFNNEEFYIQIKSIKENFTIIDDRCLCIPELTFDVPPHIDLQLFSTGYAKYVELTYGGWGIINNQLNYEKASLNFVPAAYDLQMSVIRPTLDTNQHLDYVDTPWLDTSTTNLSDEYFELIKNKIQDIRSHKEIINTIYSSLLPVDLQFGIDYADWRFMLAIPNRSKIIKRIFEKGYFVGTNFPSVAYMFNKEAMIHAEKEQSMVINLFNDFRIDESKAIAITHIIKKML